MDSGDCPKNREPLSMMTAGPSFWASRVVGPRTEGGYHEPERMGHLHKNGVGPRS